MNGIRSPEAGPAPGENRGVTFAAKCAPEESILSAVGKAGLPGVELYLNSHWLARGREISRLARRFPFRYALHAPTDSFQPAPLAELAADLGAEVVVFHDILWDDEWEQVKRSFAGFPGTVCLENVATIHQPLKFMRRFGMGFCLDLEHLQMEVGGVFEEEFLRVMKTVRHVHMTGYVFGSQLWHSHIHHTPEHSTYLLNLLQKANYSGMIVSEARVAHQTPEEFAQLAAFIHDWRKGLAVQNEEHG